MRAFPSDPDACALGHESSRRPLPDKSQKETSEKKMPTQGGETSQLCPCPSDCGTDVLLRFGSLAPLLAAANVQDGWNILVKRRHLGCEIQSVCIVQSFALCFWQRVATLLSCLEQEKVQIDWPSCCLGPFECPEVFSPMQTYNVEAVASVLKYSVSNDPALSK